MELSPAHLGWAGGSAGTAAECPPRELKILTLTTVFPTPNDPGQGVFIRARMQHIARRAQVKVLAPMPLVDYSNPRHEWFPAAGPRARVDGAMEILHPRWLFPPFATPLNPLCMYLRLAGMARRLRAAYPFDILDAHFGFPEGVAAALLARSAGRPFVVTLRGNEPVFGRDPKRRAAIAWALRRAARVFAVSEELRRYAVSLGVDEARTRTVPNGVDTESFYPRSAAPALRRTPEEKVVLSVGRLVEGKGHHRSIRALGRLRERGIQARLVIAGGPCRESRFENRIRQTIAELALESSVDLLGHVAPENMPDLMSAADILCLASDSEGWPNAVHEALACGCPVVATAVGGVPDMIPNDLYGYIVPPNDVEALAAALETALRRSWDRRPIAEWGGARSWDQVAAEVIEQMLQVVAEAPSRPAR